MDRRSFLRRALGVLGVAASGGLAGAMPAADPRKVPSGVIMPGPMDHQEKARMACISNPRLAAMIRKFNIRCGKGDDRVERFQRYRGYIKADPQHYEYLVSRGWVERDPEKQLQKLWDREWEKYGPPEGR